MPHRADYADPETIEELLEWEHPHLAAPVVAPFTEAENLAMLRLTPALSLAALPFALTRLLCYHRRVRPPYTVFVPTTEGVVLTSFPIAWFFGFLYYTETPSLFFVVTTVVAASQGRHWLAALVCPYSPCVASWPPDGGQGS